MSQQVPKVPEIKGKVDGHPKLPKGGKLVYLKPHGVDKVPALLQENEIVIPVKHAKKVAKFLKEEDIKLPNMKKGGRVKKRAKRPQPTQRQTQRQTVIIQQVASRRRRAPRKPKAKSIDNTVRNPNLLQFSQPVGGMPRLREDQPIVQAKTPSVAAPKKTPLVRSGQIVQMDLAPVKVDETADDLEKLIQGRLARRRAERQAEEQTEAADDTLPEKKPSRRVVSGPAFPVVRVPSPLVEREPAALGRANIMRFFAAPEPSPEAREQPDAPASQPMRPTRMWDLA
jgi:hypothetical protein